MENNVNDAIETKIVCIKNSAAEVVMLFEYLKSRKLEPRQGYALLKLTTDAMERRWGISMVDATPLKFTDGQ